MLNTSSNVFGSLSVRMSKYLSRKLKLSWYSTLTSTEIQAASENNESSFEKDDTLRLKVKRLEFNSPMLSKVMLQVKSKKMRDKSNLIYFEGKRVLKDAMQAGVTPLMVFFSRTDEIKELNLPNSTQLFKMPYSELKLWSDLTTAPGILAVCRKPEPLTTYVADIPVTIICDNIREPGNLGAVLRNAVGAGTKKILLSKGCTDHWDPKVIRGGAGTQFRIPIYNDLTWPDIKNHCTEDTLLLIATNKPISKVNNTELVPYYKVNYNDYSDIAVLVGGETEGVSEDGLEVMSDCKSQQIIIPLSNQLESLNSVSALSVILFEIKKQFFY